MQFFVHVKSMEDERTEDNKTVCLIHKHFTIDLIQAYNCLKWYC